MGRVTELIAYLNSKDEKIDKSFSYLTITDKIAQKRHELIKKNKQITEWCFTHSRERIIMRGKHPNSQDNLKPFKKGESGNPSGRTKAFSGLKDDLKILVNETDFMAYPKKQLA